MPKRPLPVIIPADPPDPSPFVTRPTRKIPALLRHLHIALGDHFIASYPGNNQLWLTESLYFELSADNPFREPMLVLCDRIRSRVGRWLGIYASVYEAVEAVVSMRG